MAACQGGCSIGAAFGRTDSFIDAMLPTLRSRPAFDVMKVS